MKTDGQILHLFVWDKKFVPSFIEFLLERFPAQEHQFVVYGEVLAGELPAALQATHCPRSFEKLWYLLKSMRKARKIILHGLFSTRLIYVLAMQPWLLKKCYWVIWGADLYVHRVKEKDWRYYKNEWFRRFVISRLGHVITYIKGDYELAKKWYSARGEYHECLMYLSNVVDPLELDRSEAKSGFHLGKNILLGNSADPSNNHFEILERLRPYKDEDIKIYVPLSYGNQCHARKVIVQGEEWFGEKFSPLTAFMPFDEYLRFIKSIDIAIFDHQRQQAMGNIIWLLGLGKKVYLRADVSSARFLNEIGIKTFCLESFDTCKIDEETAKRNANKVRRFFTKEALASQYRNIFE